MIFGLTNLRTGGFGTKFDAEVDGKVHLAVAPPKPFEINELQNFELSPPSFFFRAKRGEIFYMIATQKPFAPKARRFFFKNSIPKRCSESANSLCKPLQNVQFFGFGQNFRKMAARNFILGARAAVYRGAAVLFGAEEGRRTEGEEERRGEEADLTEEI